MPKRRPAIGVVSAGLGALPIVERLLLSVPDVQCTLLMDRGLVGLGVISPVEACRRVANDVATLKARGLDLVVAPDDVDREDARLTGLVEAVFHAHVHEAATHTRSGTVAVLVDPGSDSITDELRGRLAERGVRLLVHVAETLAPVLDRSLERDDLTLTIVREAAHAMRETDADVAILWAPHAHLARDLFQRSLGRSVHVVESPDVWANAIAQLLNSRDRRDPEAGVAVLSAGGGRSLAAAAQQFLQMPVVDEGRLDVVSPARELTRYDQVLLGYGALGAGDLASVESLLASDAQLCWERDGRTIAEPVRDVLQECHQDERHAAAFAIEELLGSGDLVGVTGVQVQLGTDASATRVPFSHMLRFDGHLIREIRVLSP